MGMFDEQQQIADRAGTALFHQLALERERLGIRQQTRPPDFKRTHLSSLQRSAISYQLSATSNQLRADHAAFGSQFSSDCLMCDMNSSATAPSMMRWS